MRSRTWVARLLLTIAAWVVPFNAQAQVLSDPANFQVKNVWDAPNDLGVPVNLGGLMFSPDGATLYAVAASEDPASAVYSVPVTRDPVTRSVTGLGPIEAVTKVFDGDSSVSGSGISAGLDFGPADTLFYVYWDANTLAQRPGGFGGAETQFDMGPLGVPRATSGLMFSPHLTDPGTGFGMLQVSANQPQIYNVPLAPAGGGIFTPGDAELFASVAHSGLGAVQYVPSGMFAGDVMYAAWSAGEVRVVDVDSATGLPIDAGTLVPTLGTTNPVETGFVSDLGQGPWGLEFDPLTGELFIGTWRGNPVNAIIQVGGPGFVDAPTGGTLLPGKKLLVKQKKSGTQRLQLLAKDAAIVAATPCNVDGELVIEAVGAGTTAKRYLLEADLWKPIKKKKPEKGCKYRKGDVVATALIKSGKSLKIVANDDDLGVPLSTDPRPVRIELRHGEARYCMEFGGEKGQHKADKKLLARVAGRASACPGGSPSGAFVD